MGLDCIMDRFIEKGLAPHPFKSLLDTAEAQAVLGEGVAILPLLLERYEALQSDNPVLHFDLRMMIMSIGGFNPYYYSSEPHQRHGIEYFEEDIGDLPALVYVQGEYRAPPEFRDEYVAWWRFVQDADDQSDRMSNMRSSTGGVDQLAENLTSKSWRGYERALINYGIFNMPIFIRLVMEENNPVAFAEMLALARHESSLTSEHVGSPLTRIRAVAAMYPEHHERIKLLRDWWEGHAHQFDALPKLKNEIEKSFGGSAE